MLKVNFGHWSNEGEGREYAEYSDSKYTKFVEDGVGLIKTKEIAYIIRRDYSAGDADNNVYFDASLANGKDVTFSGNAYELYKSFYYDSWDSSNSIACRLIYDKLTALEKDSLDKRS